VVPYSEKFAHREEAASEVSVWPSITVDTE
jgi:hypothetical protein